MRASIRALLLTAALLGISASVRADDATIRLKLNAGKSAYEADAEKIRKSVLEFFDKKDEVARKAGNKPAVEQIKAERQAFEDSGIAPADLPAKLREETLLARMRLDAAYHSAIREHLIARRDSDAADVEKEWKLVKIKEWNEFNIDEATVAEDGLRLGKEKSIWTKKEHSGAIEIQLVAKTESENIRIHAYQGSVVIFNWENNPRQLRVCRPDGQDERESGSIAAAKVNPLKPKVWHRIKWIITSKGMKVYADDVLVFSEAKSYDLSKSKSIAVGATTSAVDVKEFRVLTITDK